MNSTNFQGTSISDLDKIQTDGNDNDIVQSIFKDLNNSINSNGSGNPNIIPPPAGYMRGDGGAGGGVINSPNPNDSVYPMAMQPSRPNSGYAHVIGKSIPTEGDFAMMMGKTGMSGGVSGSMGIDGTPVNQQFGPGGSYMPPSQHYFVQSPPNQTNGGLLSSLTSTLSLSGLFEQLRQPILVAFIVFIVSLPALNVLMAHYVPSLLRSGGDLSTSGMVVRSLIAGALYWILLHVIAPLVN